jgi:organic hydroperoxide reductase OsmC/OhrA
MHSGETLAAVTAMADTFTCHLDWSGDLDSAWTIETFNRDLRVAFGGVTLPMSAAPSFHGDPSRPNPEQLFVAAVSACQALTFLFLAARDALVVVAYTDDAEGTLQLSEGHRRMTHVALRPRISVVDAASVDKARALVAKAHRVCYIANSVTAVIDIDPVIEVAACAA